MGPPSQQGPPPSHMTQTQPTAVHMPPHQGPQITQPGPPNQIPHTIPQVPQSHMGPSPAQMGPGIEDDC